MLRRLGIRGKVLAALSVPVLVLTLLAGIVSLESIREVQAANSAATLLVALQESYDVVAALQAERRESVTYGAGRADGSQGKDDARDVVDDAIVAMNRAIDRVDFDALPPTAAGAVRDMRSGLEALPGVRGRVDSTVPLGSILNSYTRVIDEVLQFPVDVANSIDDRRLAAIIAASASLVDLTESYHEEQVVGAEVLNGERAETDILPLSTLFPASIIAHRETATLIRNLALGDGFVLPPLGASFKTGEGTSYDGYRTLLTTGNKDNFPALDEAAWTRAASEEIAAFDSLKSNLRIAASDRAGSVASAAIRTSVVTIGGAVGALLLSIITALTIARQIVNPLRRLTAAAATVRDELPRLVDQVAIPGQGPDLSLTHIPVTSRDEIGLLATAFNEVNTTTIQVAQEQAALRGSIAEMFVNVARRDQVLLNRQLSFIDALERSEEDPKTLADLFRLDHLATRMRRNAESLLVLAGIDTGRRLREKLPLSDVIRTASSEIEHYERVQLDLPVDPMMLGHTALPAAHMMAELLENATVFSEPGTAVHVSTGIDENHVIITILDQGLGMTTDELAEVNLKIRKTSAGDVLGSQRLGMFVVGRIAARLGAEVLLTAGPDGRGTLVTIQMPLVLFVDPRSLPLTPPSTPAARVETFVLPEEAAEVVHDTAFAPTPSGVQDVAAGALGSAENPAEAVDLDALTDGATGLGLPRRRSRDADVEAPAPSSLQRDEDDAAAAPSIPLAPRADALASAAGVVSPSGDVWAPDVVQSAPLVSRRGGGDAEAPALPGRAAGLPTRQPARPVASSASPTTTPVAVPEGRAAMFSGFRSRRAELAAAAIHVESGAAAETSPDVATGPDSPDGAERLAAAAAGAAAFFGRSTSAETPVVTPAPAPMVIPGLVDDDVDYDDGDLSDPFAPVEPAEPVAAEPPAPPVRPFHPAPFQPPAFHSAPFEPVTAHTDVPQPFEPPAFEPVVETVAPVAAPVAEAAPRRRAPRHALPLDESEAEGPWSPSAPAHAASWTPAESTPGLPAEAWSAPLPTAAPAPAWAPTAAAEPAPVEAVTWDVDEIQPWTGAAPQESAGQVRDAPEPEPTWPPAPVLTGPPAEPDAAPVLPGTVWSAGSAVPAAPEFSDLVEGASRSEKPAKPRRGLFGRKRAKRDAASVAPVAEPIRPSVVEPPAGLPSVAPVRQSAWNTTDIGVHALPGPVAPVAPVVEPQGAGDGAPPWQTPVSPEPEAVEPLWAPQTAWTAPPAQERAPAEPVWAPTPGWSANGQAAPVPVRQPAPAAPTPAVPSPHSPFSSQTSFTPQPSSGSFDDEVTSMLAQRADIAQQALAELSQLSSYRPKAVPNDAQTTLVRRTPNAIPAAPAIETRSAVQRTERDANQVRSLLSSFQSGTSRGRQASDTPGTDPAGESHQATGDNGESRVGHEDGSDVDRGEPVTTPDTDLNQRGTSW